MTELGNFLREKREEKGWSLERLQTETKIQKRYLQAIEEGRYDVLPGSFYARAFIKNYCETVGLSYEEVFNQFESDIPKAAKEPTEFVPRSERTKKAVDTKESNIAVWLPKVLIFAAILAVLIGVWAYFANRGGEGADKNQKESSQPASVEPAKSKKEDKAGNTKDNKVEKPVKKTPEKPKEPKKEEFTLTKQMAQGIRTTYELKNAKNVKVGFKIKGRAYLEVSKDSKTLVSKILNKGDAVSYDVTGAKEIKLNIGAANFTDVTINGKPFSYPIPPVKQGVHQVIIIKNVSSGGQ